ncbi:GDP-D-glucose phosphorylase 1 [Scleropages formosus]|uniref:GDP-D-glucose phosphorylase 1 n=1 Tax=Scleropages formosus TaxID=113540 RepID=A0A8C9WBZ4_SCLFO|nr:GDP-D-glucose phosphorylase 1 [Scleropages formosus]
METCPTHCFAYSDRDFVSHVCRSEWCAQCSKAGLSRFDETLRSGWSAKMRQGLFRYELGDLQTRVLPGALRFVAQLNILRGTERRKPQEISSIRQHFDAKQFNFNRIHSDEIVFEMSKEDGGATGAEPPWSCERQRSHQDGAGRMLVVINVSPLEFGHCLLIPDPALCLPQILTPFAIQIGMESIFLSSHPGFRVGFNSLGAFASVNHLHLHCYYLDHELRIESAPTKPLVPDKAFHCMTDFPPGFVFYTEGEHLEGMAATICQLTDYLAERNIAHNLFLTRGCPPKSCCSPSVERSGVRILIWPRLSCFGAKEESAFNVALCELAGHLPFKSREDFDTIAEKKVKGIIEKYLLPEEAFLQLEMELAKYLQTI